MNKKFMIKLGSHLTILTSIFLAFSPFYNPTFANQTLTKSKSSNLIPSYRLGPGDKLYISVFKVEGYTAEVEVLPDGTINLPRLNPVYVWDKTIAEVKELITNKYLKILRNPIVANNTNCGLIFWQ